MLARSPRAAKIIRPLLDAMQTRQRLFIWCQSSCYLVSVTCGRGGDDHLCSAADYPSDHSGINQVPADLIEASRSFGASPPRCCSKFSYRWRCRPLWRALPDADAGPFYGGHRLDDCRRRLGQMVLRGIGRLDMGLATVAASGL